VCFLKACIDGRAVSSGRGGVMVEREDCALLSLDANGDLSVMPAASPPAERRPAVSSALEESLQSLAAEPRAERGKRALVVTAAWREGEKKPRVEFGFVSNARPNAKMMRCLSSLLRNYLLPEAVRECRQTIELPSNLFGLLEQRALGHFQADVGRLHLVARHQFQDPLVEVQRAQVPRATMLKLVSAEAPVAR
jgi:hypothetical protein